MDHIDAFPVTCPYCGEEVEIHVEEDVRGSFVLALNARIPIFDNSLYDKFTPVVGLDWTF